MNHLASALTLVLFSVTTAHASQEENPVKEKASQVVFRDGTQESFKGPAEHFTGDVQVEVLFPANDTAHYSGAYVTFAPGARTDWHLHPAGQHLVVTSGVGLTGTWDGAVVEIKAGDALWCPPGVKHWHGASPDSPMRHLAITGVRDGENVVWEEKVTDEQYNAKQE